MIDNQALFHRLLEENKIRIKDHQVLQAIPNPLPDNFEFERIEGMLLGIALGDALGNSSEGYLPKARNERFGEITDYLPTPSLNHRPIGMPSDDTQLSFWTLEQLIKDKGFNPQAVLDCFTQSRIDGMGRTVRGALLNYTVRKCPWWEAGLDSAGNGALMRVAPMLLLHLIHPTPALWCDATLAGMLTHNNHTSNAACVAYLHLLWETLRLEETPPRGWWYTTFLSFFKPLEGETNLVSRNPRYPYHGPAWAFIEDQLRKALIENRSILEACNRFYSGAYLLETIPCVLYILEQSSCDPQNAIIRSVNDTRDNDTIASLVGAAIGALYGVKVFPKRWIEGLLGRTRTDDDHRVFDLIQEARSAFWRH